MIILQPVIVIPLTLQHGFPLWIPIQKGFHAHLSDMIIVLEPMNIGMEMMASLIQILAMRLRYTWRKCIDPLRIEPIEWLARLRAHPKVACNRQVKAHGRQITGEHMDFIFSALLLHASYVVCLPYEERQEGLQRKLRHPQFLDLDLVQYLELLPPLQLLLLHWPDLFWGVGS